MITFHQVSKCFAMDGQHPRSFQESMINLFHRSEKSPREPFWALWDVSFEVSPGESVAFIGVNGSGKSTVLKLISRIIYPTSGTVSVHGRVAALLELGAGFHPDLTGRENIDLNGSILGLSRSFIRRQMDDIIAFSELERFIDVPIRSYSSGMLMRLGFSVATAFQPDILLIDEVLAVGDQVFQDRCLRRIADIKHRGATIVLVSHDLASIQKLCPRSIWLHKGRVQADGSTDQVTSRYLTRLWEEEQHKLETGAISVEPSIAFDHGAGADARPSAGAAAALEEQGQTVPPQTLQTRWGSGEVRIQKAELLNQKGEATRVFPTGGGFIVRMWYDAPQPVKHPAFGISLYDERGERINGPNTAWAGVDIESIHGQGYVDYVVDQLPLLPGHYDLTVAVYDEFVVHPYDHWHRMASFRVIPGDLERQDGTCYVPCRWVHEVTSES